MEISSKSQANESGSALQRMAGLSCLTSLKHGSSRLGTFLKSQRAKIFKRVKTHCLSASNHLSQWGAEMVGAMEKGIAAAKVTSPPSGTYEGVDLRVLPKFICFRAAMLREKVTLQYFVAILGAAFFLNFVVSRIEVSSLYDKLRAKEYILAPGVQDFVAVAPQNVPDSHVKSAVMDFIGQFGNVNPINIDEQYQRLADSMNLELKTRFLAEAADWKSKVKSDRISEVMTVLESTIEADGKGRYRAVASVRTDSFVNNEHIGYRDEVVDMSLRLVPPEDGKRWYLEISALSRSSRESYKVQETMTRSKNGKESK